MTHSKEAAKNLLSEFEEAETVRKAEKKAKKGKHKGGERGKQRKPVKQSVNKPAVKDKKYYEVIISTLVSALANLRQRGRRAEEDNFKLLAELAAIEHDHVQVEISSRRRLQARKEMIQQTKVKLSALKESREILRQQQEEDIEKLQNEYAAVENRLKEQRRLAELLVYSERSLTSKRAALLKKSLQLSSALRDKEAELKRRHYKGELEMMSITLQDSTKKQCNKMISDLVSDLHESHEYAYSSFVRDLIDENHKLQHQVNQLAERAVRLIEERNKQTAKHQEVRVAYDFISAAVAKLAQTTESKQQILEELRAQTEQLKAELVQALKFKRLYEALMWGCRNSTSFLMSPPPSKTERNSYAVDREKLLSHLMNENDQIKHLIELQRVEIDQKLRSLEYMRKVIRENLKTFQQSTEVLFRFGKSASEVGKLSNFSILDLKNQLGSLDDLEKFCKSFRIFMLSYLLRILFDPEDCEDGPDRNSNRCQSPEDSARDEQWTCEYHLMNCGIGPTEIYKPNQVGLIKTPSNIINKSISEKV